MGRLKNHSLEAELAAMRRKGQGEGITEDHAPLQDLFKALKKFDGGPGDEDDPHDNGSFGPPDDHE